MIARVTFQTVLMDQNTVVAQNKLRSTTVPEAHTKTPRVYNGS